VNMSKKYTYKRKSTKLDALTLERGYGYTVNLREGRLPIHGSSLSKAEFKLRDYLEVEELTETVKPTLAFIFSLGLAIESEIIRILTHTFGEDALSGVWGEDKELRDGVSGDDLEYKQFSFGIHYQDKPILTANADALLKLDGKYHVVEIKSTNAKDFDLIGRTQRPLDNALRQAYLYHLLITSGKTNAPKEVVDNLSDTVKVVYVNKTPQMFKSFIHVIDVEVGTIDPHIKEQINENFEQVLINMEELYEVHYGKGVAEDE
jgi:hypothetical protein